VRTEQRALVTGASGHVGSHIARALLDRGWSVLGFDRRPPPPALGSRDGFDGRIGDVRDATAVDAAADGAGLIVHAAMQYEPDAHTDLTQLAVQGLTHLAAAARRSGARLVHVSSTAALGDCIPQEHPDGLDGSVRNQAPSTAYAAAKVAAEETLDRLLEAHPDLDAAAVLPAMVIGTDDPTGTASNRRIFSLARVSRLPFWFDGGLGVVDVRDVAEGVCATAERGERGARYVLCAENLTMRELLGRIREVRGYGGLPRWRIPGAPLLAATALQERVSAAVGLTPAVRTSQLRPRLQRAAWFDGSRARAELGWVPRPVTETLRDLLR
jgi:dihydroflavonol-4-reductase